MKIRIGEVDFKSHFDAKKYARDIIGQYVGGCIGESSEHYEFMVALWGRSPNYSSGVLYFEIGRKFKGYAISSVTCEGVIDWSLRSAVAGKSVNTWTMLTVAMRQAIRGQTTQFKAKSNNWCSLCESSGTLEVDHILSFKSLMRGYLDYAGKYPDVYAYAHSGYMFRPEDREFEANWQKWHRERCLLRMLCVRCHSKCTLEARIGRPMIGYFDSESE